MKNIFGLFIAVIGSQIFRLGVLFLDEQTKKELKKSILRKLEAQ